MLDPSAFLVMRKWPAKYPDRIQLYSLPSPNGVKVSVMLGEFSVRKFWWTLCQESIDPFSKIVP